MIVVLSSSVPCFVDTRQIGQGDVMADGTRAGRDNGRDTSASEFRDQIGALRGTAESDDGLLKAVVGPNGLEDLIIESRAMRMASQDLAAALVEVVRNAESDIRRRRAEILSELGVDGGMPDMAETLSSLELLQSKLTASQGDVRQIFEEFQRQVRPQQR
jgi:hypothetical protein